ncbi:MAG: hypothetical protein KKA73_28170, partial [Chloroflexi bacterium]|nr:hypothetical protein [Chloroflexota bacterium]
MKVLKPPADEALQPGQTPWWATEPPGFGCAEDLIVGNIPDATDLPEPPEPEPSEQPGQTPWWATPPSDLDG